MITLTAEYALRAVVNPADQDAPQTTSVVAEHTIIPASYLAKLKHSLSKSGIVSAQRGLHGGFVLADAADKLTILRVVNAVEPLRRYPKRPVGLHGQRLCPLHRSLDDAAQSVEHTLGDTTMADLNDVPQSRKPLCGFPNRQTSSEPVSQQRRGRVASAMLWPLVIAWQMLLASAGGAAEEPQYNRDIRPILAENCFACHGADSAARQADLRLDHRETAIDAGSLVPGQAANSPLLARILSQDPEMVMPPPASKKQLTAEQIELLRQWIDQGAEYQPHWSLIAPQQAPPPELQDSTWVKNDIDRFVLQKLEQRGLTPAPVADPNRLFRRLHLDLTGLPPEPADVQSFVADYRQDSDRALSSWIDRLMNTPAWGEHRGRYWLDAARYADTHGLHFDNYREMWPYRDWVVRAFNANLPFDQFIVEQLAGDLLPAPTTDQLIATGFQRCNMTTNEGGTIDEENMALYAADRVQTFGWVLLGLTTNCAQCHDHKFDEFSMRDYYALAAYFRNTTQPPKDGNVKDGRGPVLVVPAAEDRARWEDLPAEIAAAHALKTERQQACEAEFQQWLASTQPESLAASVPSEGLVAHVPLNMGSDQPVKNLAPAAQPVRTTGQLEWTKDGKFGEAPVIRPGRTLELGDIGAFGRDQAFSCGAWLKIANRNGSGSVLARMDEKSDYRGWDLFYANGKISVHLISTWPSNALKVSTEKIAIGPKSWRHVFATYDGSGTAAGIKIYVDGEAQPLSVDTNTLTADASIDIATPLRIGQRSGGQVLDQAAIQEVRIYARELTGAEIARLVHAGPIQEVLRIPPADRKPQQMEQVRQFYLNSFDAEYRRLETEANALQHEQDMLRLRSPVTHIQQEKPNSAPKAHLLMRGEYDRPGEELSAAPPAALHPLPANAPGNRLGLAQWVVDSANPLTARVTVNRFWQEVFGRGIVATPEDFGVTGSLPTHPELLDWLAVDFQEHGWDVKRLFKQLLTSATYRQAAMATPEKLEQDPNNQWLSRGPRFRMDAEMVRDHALASSGLLSPALFGPPVKPYQPEKIWDIVGLPGGDTRNYQVDQGEKLYRRGLYSFWKRMAPPPNMEAFNAPSREVCIVRRERTNTPLQALVTMNDPQFVEAARVLAQRALAAQASSNSEVELLNALTWRVLGREFNEAERRLALENLQRLAAYYASNPQDAAALLAVGDAPRYTKLDSAQVAAWTVMCNSLMNLDEVLNK